MTSLTIGLAVALSTSPVGSYWWPADAVEAWHDYHFPDPVVQVDPQPEVTGVEQWRDDVAVYAGWNVDVMLRIMRCESGGDRYAVSHTSDYGLFQIHYPIWGPAFGVTTDDLFDPGTNIDIAWRVWNLQGYNAWVCY